MGQYYLFACIDRKEYFFPSDCGDFSKLMEHGYVASNSSIALLKLLETDWKNTRVVVIGDYSEEFPDDETKILASVAYDPRVNFYSFVGTTYTHIEPRVLQLIEGAEKIRTKREVIALYSDKYFVSHTAGCYIDLKKIVKSYLSELKRNCLLAVNPITLCLASGNGLGGGDYSVENPDYDTVGCFRFHKVGVYRKGEIDLTNLTEEDPHFAELDVLEYMGKK